MLKGIDTSAIKYISALSSIALTDGGSTDAVDLSNFTFATLIVNTGSTALGATTVDMVRSATSNGTFNGFGASVNVVTSGQLHVRPFVLSSSAFWYSAYYTQLNAASPPISITLAVSGTREAPIDQESSTTSYSVINST